MKKLFGLLSILVLLASCGGEESISEKEKRLAKEVVVTEKVVTDPDIVVDDNESYWYIVVEVKGGTAKYSTFTKQEHSYFSAKEAKELFNEKVFILNFIRVSKGTYEDSL